MFDDFDQLLAKLRVPKEAAGRNIMSYDEGGAVEDDQASSDEPSSGDDDIPTITMDEAKRLGATPVTDEPTGAGDDIPTITMDEAKRLGATPVDDHEPPKAESALGSGVREAAHGALPALVGLPAAAAGAGYGALVGAPLAPFTAGLSVPVGAVIGGAAAGFGGSYVASKVQEAGLEAAGLSDAEQRAANAKAHPQATFIGGMAPAIATLKPAFAESKLVERVLQGGIMGGLEAGQQLASGEGLDPTHIAEATAIGATFPKFNKLGERVSAPGAYVAAKWRPGRPDTQGRPEEAPLKDDAQQSQQPNVARGVSTTQPPVDENVTVGVQPDNKPARSDRTYPKKPANPSNPDDVSGDSTSPYMAPDIKSALSVLGAGDTSGTQGSENQTPSPAAREPIATTPEPPARVDESVVAEPIRRAGLPVPGEGFTTDVTINGKRASASGTDTAHAPAAIRAATRAASEDVGIASPHAAIDEAASATHPEPSPAQIEAENFQKGHVKGADGDPVDIYVGKSGDKKFIVDQLDANTGKFDEHKVMSNYADEASARKAYIEGFSDGKGEQRLGAISEVDGPSLKEWLKNGDQDKPYDKSAGASAITPTKAVVQNAIDALGKHPNGQAIIDAIKAAPAEQQAQLATRALKALTNTTGKVKSGEYATTRTPSERPTVEGLGVQARSKEDAARKQAAIKAHGDIFKKFAPGDNETGMDKSSLDAMKARVTAAVTELDKSLAGNGYKPNEKSAEFLWARAARQLAKMKGITPKRAAEFIATEKQLRAGTAEDISNVRSTARVEGDISRSRRSGEEVLAGAEADVARNQAAQEAPFEVPHEEAEPDTKPTAIVSKDDLPPEGTKSLDLDDPDDAAKAAAILNRGLPKWKQDQAGRDAAEQAKTERLKAARLARDAAEKGPVPKKDLVSSVSDEDIQTNFGVNAKGEKVAADKENQGLVRRFAEDQEGGLNLGKVLKDITTDQNKNAKLLASAAKKARTRETEPKRFYARGPGSPQEDYARSLGDDLFKLHQADVQHKEDLHQIATAAPKGASDEAIFHAQDSGDFSKLTPAQQKDFTEHVKPLLDQSDRLYEAIAKLDPSRLGPKVKNHIYRLAQGHAGGDKIQQTNLSADPIEGRVSAIGTNPTGTGLERQFYALQRQDGTRFVISTNPDGFTIWDKYKGQRVKAPDFAFKEGEDYKVGPNTFKMDQATVKEIEAHGRFEDGRIARYYHNPMLSAALANAELGAIARHLDYLENLKHDPAFRAYAQPPHVDDNGQYIRPKGKDGWVETALPNFHDWKMDPQLAYTFDDYAQPGWKDGGLELARQMSNAATKSIFLLPFAHINNVAAHWFVGRGWDWIKPTGYRNMVVDGMQAVKSVVTQDDLQRQLRLSGASTLYGGVLNKDFIQNIAKAVGTDIEKNPERWGKIAKTLGMNKPADLVQAMYRSSSKAMWMVNDMFITQAVKENMRKGMTMDGAINAVQKHIPAYRVPTQLVKPGPYGRLASQTMQASLPFVFGRYHYAMWNSWANIVKDIVGKEDQGAHRVEAVGQLMAAGALLFMYAYPLKKLAESVTGNKEASFHPRGPATIPMSLMEARRTGDVMGAARSSLTLNPAVSTALETLSNRDFGGRQIVEPGTAASALKGSPRDAARAVGQEAEHAVRGLVAPLNTASDAYKAGRNPAEVLRDQVFDLKNPSPRAQRWIAQQPIQQQRAVNARERNPHGPLEGLLDRFLK